MLQCLSFRASSAASASSSSPTETPTPTINLTSPANSTETTPRSGTLNLSKEYALTVQTHSYNEMWSRIHRHDSSAREDVEIQHHDKSQSPYELQLSQVLSPNQQRVEEALRHAKPTTLTRLVASYFDHTQSATRLCLLLYQSVRRARDLYKPVSDLLVVLPHDLYAITESHCNLAFDVFVRFDSFDNPFPCPESHNFHDMRSCFSELKGRLENRLSKSQSRVRLLNRASAGCAVCLVGAVVGVAVSAAVIASHSLVALLAGPLCSAYLPGSLKKREEAHISQLNAAARGTFVLANYLDTIDRLVTLLHAEIEGNKLLIRLGIERGRDVYPVQLVVKQLRTNHDKFIDQLKRLEEHLCSCFNTVNEARSLLLQEIHLHRSYSS